MIGQTIAHFKIAEKLGQGGMGVVYRAEDLHLERPVAIKFLHSSALGNDENKLRFLQEARATARLDHPNICTVYEIGESEDQIYIAMAYIDGMTLRQRLATGPMSLSETLEVGIQLCRGLNEAHELGIVHRDIKSANIMITHRANQVKIMDFGVAKVAGGFELTKTGSTVGTTAYMSPEQARGVEVDFRSDIWSIGVVLYELFTAQFPFRGSSEYEITSAILNKDPVSLSGTHPPIPEDLKKIIYTCLEKDVEKRCQSLAQVGDALEQLARAGGSKIESILPGPEGAVDQPANIEQPSEESTPAKGLALKYWGLRIVGLVGLLACGWLLWGKPQANNPDQGASQQELALGAAQKLAETAKEAQAQMVVAKQRADSLGAPSRASAIYEEAVRAQQQGAEKLDQEEFKEAKTHLDLALKQFNLASEKALVEEIKPAAITRAEPKSAGPTKAELAARKAAATRQAEAARKAAAARQAEAARKAEETRQAEAARKAEEARQAEEARKEEEARQKNLGKEQRQAVLVLQAQAHQEKTALESSHRFLRAYEKGEAAELLGQGFLKTRSYNDAAEAFRTAVRAYRQAAAQRADQIEAIGALVEGYRREYAGKNLEGLKRLHLAMDPAEEQRLATFFQHIKDLTVQMTIRDDQITFLSDEAWAIVDVHMDFSRSRGGGDYSWKVDFVQRQEDWLIAKIDRNRL